MKCLDRHSYDKPKCTEVSLTSLRGSGRFDRKEIDNRLPSSALYSSFKL